MLLGNVVVGGVIALGVLFGGLAVGPANGPLWAGVALGGVIVFAREIAKDVEDAEGDRIGGARTLPLAWGERRALALSLIVVGLVIASLPLAAEVVSTSFYVWGLPLAGCLLVALWSAGGGPGRKRGAPSRSPRAAPAAGSRARWRSASSDSCSRGWAEEQGAPEASGAETDGGFLHRGPVPSPSTRR